MTSPQRGGRHDDEAGERTASDSASSRRGLAWLGVLVVGLALAAGLCYFVYRMFSGFLDQYAPA